MITNSRIVPIVSCSLLLPIVVADCLVLSRCAYASASFDDEISRQSRTTTFFERRILRRLRSELHRSSLSYCMLTRVSATRNTVILSRIVRCKPFNLRTDFVAFSCWVYWSSVLQYCCLVDVLRRLLRSRRRNRSRKCIIFETTTFTSLPPPASFLRSGQVCAKMDGMYGVGELVFERTRVGMELTECIFDRLPN